MNHLIAYVKSPLVSLCRFEHGLNEPHYDPPEETVSYYSVNFIERGSFTLRIGREEWQMSSGMVFNTSPDLSYRCRHADEFPQCISFSIDFEESFAHELISKKKPGHNRLAYVMSPNNRIAYLYMRLRRLSESDADVMQAETLAGELFTAVTYGDDSGCYKPHRSHQLAWYIERVEAARSLMESQYSGSHTLNSLARFTGMSPFHFARTFRELMGTPPHRYLLRIRLARAAEFLREGTSVTQTCFATGFNNLSHFTRLFQHTYGYPPSQFAGKRKRGKPDAEPSASQAMDKGS